MKKINILLLVYIMFSLLLLVDTSYAKSKDISAHNFPYGYCTWYVAQQTFIPFSGNANQWLHNAKQYGFKVYDGNSKTYKYAILVTNENRYYGHVVWITNVKGDRITVKEMNYVGFAKESTRTFKKGDTKIEGIILTKKAIYEEYHNGYEKYEKYKDNKKKYKKYKEYKDDYEKYKALKKQYENGPKGNIWK